MTSMEADSVATILCTAKQTRFNIATPSYRELDIDGLNITVKADPKELPSSQSSSDTTRKRSKVKSQGIEILSNATLRLKAGQRYALVGRNGTGKSTLLRAISEKLIPGIPEETRVVLLQQTSASDVNVEEPLPGGSDAGAKSKEEQAGRNVLEEVIERATSKQNVQQEIKLLTQAVESTQALGALKGLRELKYERLQKELFLKDKDARLRSGARGLQARKALKEMEKKVEEFKKTQFEQKDEDISPETLAQETSEAADMLAELQLQVEPSKMAQVESKAKQILTGLGFSETMVQKPVSSLSGGWKMRTSLATALLQDTDILILDEPTNFLDLLGIMWLQRHLAAVAESSEVTPPTLMLVSHDRDFISLCTDLLILRDKEITYFHGDLPSYEASRAEKKVHLTKMQDALDRKKDHIQQTIQRNMREGKAKDDTNKIRQAKSRQKKLDDRMGLEVSAKGTRFKLNRDLVGYHLTARADIDIPQDEKAIRFSIPSPPELRFPGSLVSLDNISFRYPPLTTSPPNTAAYRLAASQAPTVLQDISLTVQMGDRIGILGLNGSGKSTLIKLLVEQTRPTAGTLTHHPRLRLGYYSQHAVDNLLTLGTHTPDLTALRLLLAQGGITLPNTAPIRLPADTENQQHSLDEPQVRALLGMLGLPGRIASDIPIRKLSGGQLVRLEMARILATSPQLLVLDEVTTHLDYETVTALRSALKYWPGAVVLVSHDRWFVKGVVEGISGDDNGASGSDDSDEDGHDGRDVVADGAAPRRRLVYRIRQGKMQLLSGGVQEFEDRLEKRVRKLMDS